MHVYMPGRPDRSPAHDLRPGTRRMALRLTARSGLFRTLPSPGSSTMDLTSTDLCTHCHTCTAFQEEASVPGSAQGLGHSPLTQRQAMEVCWMGVGGRSRDHPAAWPPSTSSGALFPGTGSLVGPGLALTLPSMGWTGDPTQTWAEPQPGLPSQRDTLRWLPAPEPTGGWTAYHKPGTTPQDRMLPHWDLASGNVHTTPNTPFLGRTPNPPFQSGGKPVGTHKQTANLSVQPWDCLQT